MRLMPRMIILVSSFLIMVTAEGFAQSSGQDATIKELQHQLEEMRSQMATMQNRIATLEAARGNPDASSSTESIALQSQPAPQPAIRSQPEGRKSADESAALHFKGLALTPGGFLDSTALVRTRNENADMATSYSTVPLNGSSNANLSELRGTARTSQLSLLIQTASGNTKLRGYIETDFLGASPTSNYVQSSAWTPRLRQAWTQIEWPSGWTVTAGQMWSLLTTNRHGIANLEELRPRDEDAGHVVGSTWTRERAVRITRNFNDRVWVGFALENPESTYSAAFVPPNVMGLNTSPNAATGVNLLPFLANYNGSLHHSRPGSSGKGRRRDGLGTLRNQSPGPFFPRPNCRNRGHHWPYEHDPRLWCWFRHADAVCEQTSGASA